MIQLINRQKKIAIDRVWLESLAQELLGATGHASFDLGILLTTNRTIARYNKVYRHKQGPTDILSFSFHPGHIPGTPVVARHPDEQNLGDLILSLEYIQAYCAGEKVSFEHRLMILITHGICHLLGYDHEDDAEYAVMHNLEEKLIRELPPSLKR